MQGVAPAYYLTNRSYVRKGSIDMRLTRAMRRVVVGLAASGAVSGRRTWRQHGIRLGVDHSLPARRGLRPGQLHGLRSVSFRPRRVRDHADPAGDMLV